MRAARIGATVGWTFCSGIGAPEMAAPWVDWRLASEIEDFPREVLRQRFGYQLPEEQNQGDPLLWGDFTEITPDLARARGVPLPELIVAGTPCQAFSMAGMRKGVRDPRGNLTLKFVETCHAIVDARHDGKLTVLWENVYGVLSDKENAFGCFLGGLVGSGDALSVPGGGSWPSAGMVAGPRARVAWRVFDAKYFGVAQRRRRVFLVADFGGRADPAAIFFERQGVRGNSAPRRGPGQDPAGTLSARSEGGGGLGTDFELAGGLQPVCMAEPHAHTPTAEGPDFCALDAWAVRRLMPVEGHRLQGFPDDHCAIGWRGKGAPDGLQFKALGNSMAVPNVEWILTRLAVSAGWSEFLI